MMRRFSLYIIGVALCCVCTCRVQAMTFSDSTVVYTKAMADSAYAEADYITAAYIYERLIAERGESAAVYYNLGGAYYRLDDIARSILYYERALLLEPSHVDAQFNLELARSKAVDKNAMVTEFFFTRWYRSFAAIMSADSWAKASILCFIICISCFVIFIFSKKRKTKKIIFIFALLSLLGSVLAGVIASGQTRRLQQRDHAIVMEPSVTVRSTPSESGTELFVLHEGKKVKIKDDSLSAWKEVELEDGHIGWLPAAAIEKI